MFCLYCLRDNGRLLTQRAHTLFLQTFHLTPHSLRLIRCYVAYFYDIIFLSCVMLINEPLIDWLIVQP